jgi:hypothetical protein
MVEVMRRSRCTAPASSGAGEAKSSDVIGARKGHRCCKGADGINNCREKSHQKHLGQGRDTSAVRENQQNRQVQESKVTKSSWGS